MVETKGIAETRANWEASHGRVPQAYSAGVSRATNVIAKGIAAEDLYAAKVQEAIAKKSRAKALAKISDAEWKEAALKKGAPRIASGMAAAKEKYAANMATVLSVIESVSLPPRTADPMANVDNRVKPIVAALAKMKE
ncbi:MAG: hypothetical protein KAQ85_00765 [Thermodesulfovibrionia bacterium]|nr:hypothetical protein [Thermodesulfovibrionia bacterium]